jgi:flagellar hook-associated protein 1 FlgK
MTSSFSGLTNAYTGLVAARQGLDVTGDNITNATTPGYSRETVLTSALTPASESQFATVAQVGDGVSIDGVVRVDSPLLDAQVRTTSASSGYAAEQSTAMDSIESALNEPGDNGLSSSLQAFWSDWQNVSTQSTSAASATTVIAAGQQIASQLADGYTAASNQWASTRSNVDSTVAAINTAASQIAELNGQISSAIASGGNANSLMDQENTLAVTVANLSGATVRSNANGTMDVLLGGNALVSGTTVHAIAASGATSMDGAGTSPVQINFVDNASATVGISSGTLGADLSLLAPSNASGTGGAIAEAAQSYNDIATSVATTVNAIHETGANAAGTTGLDFFALNASQPAALGLSVIPTDASGIASATPGTGAANGDVASQISQLTSSATGPDSKWSAFVVSVGVSTQAATAQATITASGSATAVNNQLSESSVDTDQETTNMLTFQHAFDAAARVMTTVDDMLDTLINKTGLVGIN